MPKPLHENIPTSLRLYIGSYTRRWNTLGRADKEFWSSDTDLIPVL